MPDWAYHNKCACNEYDALLNRHAQQVEVDERTQSAQLFKANFHEFAIINKVEDYKKMCVKEVMENTRPKLKGRYRKAYNNLRVGLASVFSNIHKVQSFVKFEKADGNKIWDDRKPARLIQHRSYEYCYLLKAHLLPITKHCKSNDKEFKGQVVSTMYAAGKNSYQIAESLMTMWNEFNSPVAICLDCKAFDGHVNGLQRNTANKFWDTASNGNRLLRRLMQMQSRNECKTQNDLRYTVHNVRCSGDFNTSDENSNINIICIRTAFGDIKLRLIVMGDDSVAICESEDVTPRLLTEVVNVFSDIGHNVKVDKICYQFQEIEFCQSSPVRIDGIWRMVRAPIRTISRARYTDTNWHDIKRYLTSIGLCELACNSGVPILQQFSLYLMSKGDYKKPVAKIDRENAVLEDDLKIKPVTAQARQDFEIAFGVSALDQIRYEEIFKCDINQQFIEKYKSYHKR